MKIWWLQERKQKEEVVSFFLFVVVIFFGSKKDVTGRNFGLEHSICSLFLIYLATRMALLVFNV